MIKLRRPVRLISHLLVSIFLVFAPVLSMPLPVRAAATVDQIASNLGMTSSSEKQQLSQLLSDAGCLKDVYDISANPRQGPGNFLVSCRGLIKEILQLIGPYLERNPVLKALMPYGFQEALAIIKAVYTTETGNKILDFIDKYAINYGGCAIAIATWSVLGYTTAGGAIAIFPGVFIMNMTLACGQAAMDVLDEINKVIAQATSVSPGGMVSLKPTAKSYCPGPNYSSAACKSWSLNYCPGPNYSSPTCIGWTDAPDQSTVPGATPGTGVGVTPTPPQCTPGPNEAAVFVSKNHQGTCVKKPVGTYNDPSAIGLPNDDIESLKLGSGASLQLCDNPNINSYCEWFNQDDLDLSNNTLNVNTVSSMKVMGATSSGGTGCEPGYSEVSLHVDNDYQGACVVKGIGTYNNPAELGIANDAVSSIKVGNGVKVRVCEHDGNGSPCEIIDRNETRLSDNMINEDRISSAQVMSAGGVTLCTDPNYQGTCKTFDNGEVDNLADFGLSNNVSSIKVSSAHTLFMFSGLDQTGTPSSWNEDRPDLSVHSWNDFARSIRIERTNDTGCSFDPNANGIYLYRDGGFYPGGGCKLVTGDIADLRPSTFDGFTGIKFMGSYKYSYKVKVYKDTNFNNFCGEYWLDQAWMAGPDCTRAQGGVVSLKLEPYTPPNQARNIVTSALRDSPDTQAVVDDNLDTQWIGGHKKPLGFVFESPKLIKSVVVFDRLQSPTDNNQNNKSKLVFSDGTIIADIDMGSGGPRCAQVTMPAKAYSWVNVVPDDASGNNGFREVQIWDTTGEVFSNINCINKYDRTPVPGTGPAPTATWPTVVPPSAVPVAPGNNLVLPANTTNLNLGFNTGDQFKVHVWGNSYDYISDWSTATQASVANLTPGSYSWQVKSTNSAGEGPWSAVQNFTINTPPLVIGNGTVLDAGTTQTLAIQAYDSQLGPVNPSVSGLPSFATVTPNGNGAATITLNPTAAQAGTYTVDVTASDGQVSGSDTVSFTVNAPVLSANYQAAYFNNRTLTGTPVLTRDETAVNNDWGSGGPGNGVTNDNFSARWTKTTDFSAGDYSFSVTADDGVRLYIDDVLAIDKWLDQGPTTYTVTKTLAAGNHTVKMEYYEYGGGAVAKLSYAQVATPTPPPAGDYTFLKGINFNGSAATIDGNAWSAMSTALSNGLSFPAGYTAATTSLTPSPAVDSATSGMLNTAIWKQNAPLPINQTVTNGDYQVYLWIMENYQTNNRKINVKLEGAQVATDIGYLAKNAWVKYGPYSTTVSDGTLNAELVNALDSPHIMGMAIYKKNGSSTPPTPLPAGTITSGAVYKIVNPSSGKVLDVNAAATNNGALVQLWEDAGNAAQQWRATLNSDGTYTLLNPNSNKVTDVYNASTADGAQIVIWGDGGGSNQRWVITQNSDGTYKLRAPHTSNKVLDVNGGLSANGTKIQIWTDNGSAAQKWQFVPVSTTPPPPPPAATPTFTGSGTVTPANPNPGATVTLNSSFTSTSSVNSTVRIHLEVRNPTDQQVYSRDFDNEAFTPGQTKNYTTTWTIPTSAATGGYIVKGGATNAAMDTWHLWSNNLGTFTVTAPSAGTELLTTAWNLTGNNGASEKYQSIASNALAGKTTLRVTYNLHGLNAIGGDASAVIFDQNGWKYISLANYGQNGLNGSQTVDIPISAFGLDLSQPVGTLHTRFWYGGAFSVDITSVKVL